jgi:hypothetical protein
MYIVANDYNNNLQPRKCTCGTILRIFQDNIYIDNWLLFKIAINAMRSTKSANAPLQHAYKAYNV